LDVITEVRKKFAEAPVIIMTGYAIEGRLQQALSFPKTTYLAKPFDLNELERLIKAALPA
jgi:DNA-binding NtrC family response regulator